MGVAQHRRADVDADDFRIRKKLRERQECVADGAANFENTAGFEVWQVVPDPAGEAATRVVT